jgi:hypothetical protein
VVDFIQLKTFKQSGRQEIAIDMSDSESTVTDASSFSRDTTESEFAQSAKSSSKSSESEFAQSSKSPNDWISLPGNDVDSNSTHGRTVWEKIAQATANANKGRLLKAYQQDRSHFKRKFSDAYLYRVKDWLVELDDFVKNDVYWESIEDTRVHGSDSDDSDEEALLSAIDKRKYRIYKAINWDIVDSVMQGVAEDDSDTSVEEDETQDVPMGTESEEDQEEDDDMAEEEDDQEEDGQEEVGESNSEDTSDGE